MENRNENKDKEPKEISEALRNAFSPEFIEFMEKNGRRIDVPGIEGWELTT